MSSHLQVLPDALFERLIVTDYRQDVIAECVNNFQILPCPWTPVGVGRVLINDEVAQWLACPQLDAREGCRYVGNAYLILAPYLTSNELQPLL